MKWAHFLLSNIADLGSFQEKEKSDNTCAVVFDSLGGSSVPAVRLKPGSAICPPPLPSREDCVFGGWYKDTDCTESWHFDLDLVTEDITLYARWISDHHAERFLLSQTDSGYNFTIMHADSYCDFVVPVQLDNKIITELSDFAMERAALKGSITVPGSIKRIGSNAFESQIRLNRVILERGVEQIGICAFKRCHSLKTVRIPDTVTVIEDSAFSGCAALREICIPDGIQILCANTFYSCSNLASVTIGNGVTDIKDTVFQNCTELTAVTLGNSLQHIGIRAFQNCEKLPSIVLPNSLRSIGQEAFGYCRSLTNIRLHKNITTIGLDAFIHCSHLKQNLLRPDGT